MLKAILCKLTAITLVFAQITVFAPVSVYAENTITLPETLRYPPREDGIERFTADFIKTVFDKTHERSAQVRVPFKLSPVTQSAESMITTAEGGSVRLGNAQIEIPSGALERDTVIRITRLYETEDTGEDIRNATLGGGGYRFEPAGTVFNVPVTIKMGYDRQLTESAKETLYTYFYDTQERKWEQLERTALEEDYVVSVTTHFTDMINGTLTLPEGPAPLDFNINSIKGLEAANPGAGVAGLEGLEANNNGTASFRIPIEIPAGRAGMTPQVAVTYSSDGGNGIMGKGFNLTAGGSVTTDTRWGSPRYNGKALVIESELLRDTYLLDGVKLEPDLSSLGSGTIIYNPMREARFDRIERHITGDYWVVTDKSGTQRTYGKTYWSGEGGGHKFTWELEEERDVFGNTIRYVYSGGHNQLFLEEIIYTGRADQSLGPGGYGDLEGYSVKFIYYDGRQDVRTDGRGGYVGRTDRLLTGIEVNHIENGTAKIIRQYKMEYKPNFFGTNQMTEFGQVDIGASGAYFWSYKFEYTEMGRELFADPEDWGNMVLQSQTSESMGGQGSISGGLGVGYEFLDVRANISYTLSGSKGSTETTQTFVDINGDGKPDSVTYNNGIKVRLNTGDGFGAEQPVAGDRPKNIGNDESSTWTTGTSWGVGAGLWDSGLIYSRSVTEQGGYNSSDLIFTDIDGDGLIDIVMSGDTHYLRNSSVGNSVRFIRVRLPILDSFDMPSETVVLSEEENNKLDKQYYHQTPFREWLAPEGGTVGVVQEIKPEGVLSSDGLTARTYYPGSGDSNPSEIRFYGLEGRTAVRGSDEEKTITAGQSIYFISDTGEDTRGDTIDWDVSIYYKRMRYFGDMDRKIRIIIPNYLERMLEDEFKREYSAISELFTPYPAGSGSREYYYVTNGKKWENEYIGEEDRRSSWETLRRLGWFVPGIIDAANFELIWREADDTDRQRLIYYYQYHAGSDTYIRNDNHNLTDSAVVLQLNVCEHNISALIQEVQAKLGGGTSFYDEISGFAFNREEFSPVPGRGVNEVFIYKSVSEEIGRREEGTPGYVYNTGGNGKRLVVDVIDGKVWSMDISAGVTFAESEAGNTFSSNLFSNEPRQEAGYYIDGIRTGNANYTRESNGRIKINIPVSNGSGRIYELFYEFSNINPVAGELTAGEIAVIREDIRAEKYVITAGRWAGPEYEKIEPVLRFLSENGRDADRAFFLGAYNKASKVLEPNTDADYTYTLKNNLTNGEKAGLNEILRSYGESVFLTIDFPFYVQSGDGGFILKDEYKNVNINDVLRGLGNAERNNRMKFLMARSIRAGYIYYAGNLSREIRYYAGGMHDIIYAGNHVTGNGSISILTLENDDDVCRFVTRAVNGRKTYWNSGESFTTDFGKPQSYNVPVGQGDYDLGKTLAGLSDDRRKEIIDNMSGNDMPDETTVTFNTIEPLPGRDGWYYGIWMGNQENSRFNRNKILVKTKTEEETDKLRNDIAKSNAVASIDYMAAMTFEQILDSITAPGKDRNETLINSETGHDAAENTLSSGVSQFNARGEDGKINTVTYFSYISGNIIHTIRLGGSGYYDLKAALTPMSQNGKKMPTVRRGGSKGTDTADPVISLELLGAAYNHSVNESDSWVSQSVQGIGGNGLTDIVQVTKSASGGDQLLVTEGSRAGFASSYVISGIKNINVNKAEITTDGGSFGAKGAAILTYGREGSIKSVGITSSGIGLSFANGTNSQTGGFIDINGDGLPDYFDGGTVRFNFGRGNFKGNDTPEGIIFNSTYARGVLNEGSSHTTGVSLPLGGGSFGLRDKTESPSTEMSVGVGGSFNYSSSMTYTDYMLMDVNGDGLPDIVRSGKDATGDKIFVRFNMGDRFSTEEKSFTNHDWGIDELLQNFYNTGGNADTCVFNDVPMIGTFDKVDETAAKHHEYRKDYEKTHPLESVKERLKNLEINSSVTNTLSISANAGVAVHIPVWVVKINVNAGAGGGANFSTGSNDVTMRMMDMDGDGLPDRVAHVPASELSPGKLLVQRNLSGQVGLLNGVTTPQGGQYHIDYAYKPGTTDMPQSRYVMSEVRKVNTTNVDVSAQPDIRSENEYVVKYEYTGGYYHRDEKEFLGFVTVRTTIRDKDNTFLGGTITQYYNNAYYSRGMAEVVRTFGNENDFFANRNPLTETVNRIDIAPFARIKSETQSASENGGRLFEISSSTYTYDVDFGNVTRLVQTAHGSETITAELTYDHNGTRYIHANPASITVRGETSGFLRKREGSYDPDNGRLITLAQRLGEGTNGQDSVSSLKWDEYGNLKKIIDPNGAYVEYTYDEETQQFVERIESGGNGIGTPYTSSIAWDHALGKKTREKDQNGNEIRYVYDDYGRLIEVWSPYDDGETPSVSYSYERRNNGTWYAVTDNKIHFSGNNPETLKTVIMTDSLGRVLYTAKQGEKWENDSTATGWNVSGFTAYDGKGRSVASGQPLFIEGNEVNSLLSGINLGNITLKNPTIQRYDAIDRTVMTILPAENINDRPIQRVSYNINNGIRETKTTDPLGNISVQTVDGRGNITQVQRFGKTESSIPLTSATYTYNGMGEMLSAVDADGNPLTITYDRLGRRTGMSSRDMGNREWQYDKAGNVITERNSELSRQGRQINYNYDGMNRLTEIVYPFSENTRYEYGAAGAEGNSAGRVTRIIDETGTIEYNYGMLGEVKEETREIKLLPLSRNETKTATMRYLSDYLGRMQEIEYPDGEIVTYEYNYGGEIKSVKGIRENTPFDYVKMVGYDEFTQRVYIKYGSGIETNYTYDPHRRWLSSIRTTDLANNVIQNISYEFDTVGNVKGYENDTRTHTTSQSYTYDDLYQLIAANGTSRSHPYVGSTAYTTTYRQDFMFDHIGNMLNKTSESFVSNRERIGDDLNYNLDYSYYAGTHKAERIGNRYYSYDQNGNLVAERDGGHAENTQAYRPYYHDGDIYWTDYGFGVVRPELSRPEDGVYQRNYKWNERNLLSESSDSAYTVQYRYGADGQRAVKYTLNTSRSTLYFNRMWQVNDSRESPVQSKHIYVGETRIATKNNSEGNPNTSAELNRVYYYHSDHLGSAQTVTNYQGQIHERLEYTPYGELWINWKSTASGDITPFRFTGKERDEETGLYYYGARYLDARTSRWLSGDPAVTDGSYLPSAPINDEAKKRNGNLPGQGGIFNTVNMHAYHYAGNNPVKYIDPDGKTPMSYRSVNLGLSYIHGRRVETYSFSASSMLDNAVFAFAKGILPFGNQIVNRVGERYGFQEININNPSVQAKLEEAAINLIGYVNTAAGFVSTGATIADIAGVVSAGLSKAGGIATLINLMLSGVSVVYELTKQVSVDLDFIIEREFGNLLVASSHENVAALYAYTKERMAGLYKNDAFSYTKGRYGSIRYSRPNNGEFNELREELRILRTSMGE